MGGATRPLDAENLDILLDEQFGKVRAILPADTGDQCALTTHPAIVPSRTQYACVNVE